MSDRYFLDTNVFVYSFDRDDPEKRERATSIIAESMESRRGVISYQVIQEFLNVALRKFRVPLKISDCREYLRGTLLPLCRIHPDPALFSKALDVREVTEFSFYDSLIVAAAIHGECSRLLSEDLQDGRQIEGVTITNPFTAC